MDIEYSEKTIGRIFDSFRISDRGPGHSVTNRHGIYQVMVQEDIFVNAGDACQQGRKTLLCPDYIPTLVKEL